MAFRKQQKRASGEVPELGAIFMSNRATKEMCFSWKTFGLPYTWESFVKKVKAGMFLFLFEHETRMLYGVYQACSDGAMDFSSEAFSSAENNYPAQVKFKVLWYCKPLSEDVFRPAIKDNYFTAHKFKFGLSRNQVRELLWLFHSRMLRGDLLWEEMLPSDPSLIPDATRSCSIAEIGEVFAVGVQDGSVPENVNALEPNTYLEKFSMPNREVRDSLLIEDDKDNAHIDADINPPVNKYERELSQQHKVTQVRDRMEYGRKLNNDCELNSGVLYMSSDEGYDPDIPLFNNMQRFHVASILRQPVASYDPSQTISHHGDALLHFSTACNPADISQDSKVCTERQPIPQNKQSVFSRLKPALEADADADAKCELKDPHKSINDMVNEVMENLSGHYHQLVRESNLLTKHLDDGDNNSKNELQMKKPQPLQSSAANYEQVASTAMVFDASTDNYEYETETGRQIIGEIPYLNFKRRSEVHKKRNADEGGLSEMSSAILAEKHCKRRKLVRQRFSEKLSNKDVMVDKISETLSLSCQPVQDGSYKTGVPLSYDKAQTLLVTGNLGSNVRGECNNGQSGSNNFSDGSASESQKHVGQSLSGPSACDSQQLPKQFSFKMKCDAVLDEGVSTKLELGRALNVAADFCVDVHGEHFVSVTELGDDRLGKPVELVECQQELRNDLDLNANENTKLSSSSIF